MGTEATDLLRLRLRWAAFAAVLASSLLVGGWLSVPVWSPIFSAIVNAALSAPAVHP